MNFGRILAKRSYLTPDKVALVFEGNRYTYFQLNNRANRLANALLGKGLKPGDRAAVLLFNCPEYLEIYFALAKVGIAMVPLNFRMAAPELEYILKDSMPKAIFFGAEFTELIEKTDKYDVELCCIVGDKEADFLEYEKLIVEGASTEAYIEYDSSETQLIMYTSGTTGRPKGAMLSHNNSTWNAINTAADFGIRPDDITLSSAPLFHIGGLNVLTTPHFYLGATIVLTREFDPENIWRLVDKEGITNMFAVPQMYQLMAQDPSRHQYRHDSLRFVESGGGPCPIPLIMQYFDEINVMFMQGYGLTEASPSTTLLRSEDALRKAGSIGKPFLHVDVKVVDETGDEVRPGEVGELLVRGPTVMSGYWQLSQETSDSIRDGWLYTGDLARFDEEGYFYIVDRKKDMIISGGENIYPAEIEQVLYTHPKVSEAAVVGIPDDKWGEAVKAFIVVKEGQELSEEEVISCCRENLAGYKKPKHVQFIKELPRNASGKVLKRILREHT